MTETQAIPSELRTLNQWVCWHYEDRNGKATKPPIDAKSNGKLVYAKSNDPSTWADFETAVATTTRLKLQGVGLNLSADDGLTGLDLDHVLDPDTFEVDPLAVEVLERFASTYIEVSPSGTGFRIWCYGKPQRSGKCDGSRKWLEVYAHPSNRYLTVTGNRYGIATAVTNQQEAIDWLHERFMQKPVSTEKESIAPASVGIALDDDQALLNKASRSKSGSSFDALWAGDLSAHNNDHSAADLALLNALAFWTGKDAPRMDRLFRQSGLMRPKWDELHGATTYGQGTIDEAIAQCREIYSGKKPSAKATKQRAKADQCGDEAATPRIGFVTVRAGEYPEATDAAEKHLIAAQVGIFQRGCLVRISREPTATVRGITRPVGAALIAPLGETYLRDLLDRLVEWQKWNDKVFDYLRCSVPPDIAKRLLSRAGMWKFPILTGVVTAPTLRPDGLLIDAPGYDKTTGLFLDFQGEKFPAIPDAPTMEQGKAALALIVREVLENRCVGADENVGFAFASPAAKAAALSAIITALVRHTVAKAPLHLFSARRAGSGKSLLADVVALIATGKTATILDLAEDGDEQEKRLLSVFIAGDAVINLDNVDRPLGGSAICKALTAETFTGRILGQSQNATVPTTATWLATGNNVIVKEDLTRRVVLCQLDPQTESPEKREFERNLEEWIPANRPGLVMAALTALRSYVVAGKPKQSVAPMGSFEDWHRLVRSALTWLGEADPLGDTGEMEDTDPTRLKLRALIYAWHNAFKAIPTTAKEAVARANSNIRDENGDEVAQDSLLRDALTDHFTDGRKGGISTRYLGDFLSKIKGRIECGARFEQAGKAHSAQLWRVKIIDPRRFEAEKGESGESGESLRSQSTIFRNSNLGNKESDIFTFKNECENNIALGKMTPQTPLTPLTPQSSPSVDANEEEF